MPDGLKVIVDADTDKAVAALKHLGDETKKTGDDIGKTLSFLESAFIDAIKPIDQLAAEISALQDEIGKSVEPSALKRYNDQIGKLTTQMNNLKVVGFETTLGKVNNSAAATAATMQQKLTPGINSANNVFLQFSRIIQDAPFGIIGFANNISPAQEALSRFGQTAKDTGVSTRTLLLKALVGPGGLGLAFGVITAAAQFAVVGFSAFTRGLGGTSEASKKAAEALKKQKELMDGIIQDVAKEINQVQVLVQVLKNETLTRQQRVNAIKELERIAPEYFATLNAEKSTIEDITRAYDRYLGSIRRIIEGKVTEKELLDVTERRIKLERELNKPALSQVVIGNKLVTVRNAVYDADGAVKKQQEELVDLRKLELDLVQKLARLQPPDKVFKEAKIKSDKSAENDIIQTAKFLESQFVFEPEIQFSKFDTNADELRKARRIVSDFLSKPVIFKVPFVPLLSEPPKEEVEDDIKRFKRFFQKEVQAIDTPIPATTDFTLLQALIDEKKLKAQQDKLGAIFGVGKDNIFTDAQKQAVFTAQAISGILTPAFNSLFDAIKAGENPVKALFKSLAQSVADLVQRLIQAAIQAAILSAIFPGGVNSVKGFGNIFKNILGFAQGGIVSGPTLALIGEGVGTSRSNPEVVAPLDQLRSMLADLGGGGQTVVVMGTLRGDKFRLMQDRTARRQRRTTGR